MFDFKRHRKNWLRCVLKTDGRDAIFCPFPVVQVSYHLDSKEERRGNGIEVDAQRPPVGAKNWGFIGFSGFCPFDLIT